VGYGSVRETGIVSDNQGMEKRRNNRMIRTIRVLIVDDHPLFREGLERALGLEDDIDIVGHGQNGEEAVRLTRELQPDVLLLDVNLPGINGIQVARHLRSKQAELGIVMLTAYHDKQQVVHAIRAGASAYCNKDISPDDLVEVIRDVASGYYVVEGQRMDRYDLRAWVQINVEAIIGPNAIEPDEHLIPLSPRETEILQSVTRGLSNKEIATQLGISQQTVKNHMTSILRKLNVEDRTQAAVTALRHGWVRIQDENDR
jgi:DNA-binding NarL/FixJ family response regulator